MRLLFSETASERSKTAPVVYRASVTEISLRGSRPGAIESRVVAPLKRGEWRDGRHGGKRCPGHSRIGCNTECDTLSHTEPAEEESVLSPGLFTEWRIIGKRVSFNVYTT